MNVIDHVLKQKKWNYKVIIQTFLQLLNHHWKTILCFILIYLFFYRFEQNDARIFEKEQINKLMCPLVQDNITHSGLQ